MPASPEKNRHRKRDDCPDYFFLALPVLRSRRDLNVRFGGCDLARGSAEENTDGERDDATDEDKPGPRNPWPPLGHEPAKVPISGRQLSTKKRQKIKSRNRDLT